MGCSWGVNGGRLGWTSCHMRWSWIGCSLTAPWLPGTTMDSRCGDKVPVFLTAPVSGSPASLAVLSVLLSGERARIAHGMLGGPM